MNKVTEQVKTIILVFACTILGMLVTGGVDVLTLDGWSDWRPYIAGGVAAVIAWGFNFLNQYDPRYGVGSDET